jgi:hypothetical protein
MDSRVSTLENRFLVIRLNAFTSKIDDGYFARRNEPGARFEMSKTGDSLSPVEIAAEIARNPDIRIKFLST